MVVDITSISFLANFFVCLIIRPFLMKNFGIKFHRASLSIILQILIFAFNTFAIFIPVGCSVSFFLFFFFLLSNIVKLFAWEKTSEGRLSSETV